MKYIYSLISLSFYKIPFGSASISTTSNLERQRDSSRNFNGKIAHRFTQFFSIASIRSQQQHANLFLFRSFRCRPCNSSDATNNRELSPMGKRKSFLFCVACTLSVCVIEHLLILGFVMDFRVWSLLGSFNLAFTTRNAAKH